ncbi:hypothetical protein AEQU1_02494 [Aequorivita sp. CIP111184]|nr:hypothetical protein AEQU1_02494 [Aequorivita sp. CIP111184]
MKKIMMKITFGMMKTKTKIIDKTLDLDIHICFLVFKNNLKHIADYTTLEFFSTMFTIL